MDFDKYFPRPELKRFVCEHDFVPDGQLICRTCGVQVPELVNPFVPFRERSALNTPYCKTSHFKSKLDELCCTEPVVIPNDVMEICKECFTPETVRVMLQRHRLKAHYSHIYIILKQKGVDIPAISFQEREQLIHLFKRVVLAYGKLGKSNIICIHFILSKLFSEIGREEMTPFLFALKSRKKRAEYETLWDLMQSLECP
jgi:hypothetical protein